MLDENNPYRAAAFPVRAPEPADPPPTTADYSFEVDDVAAVSLCSAALRRQRRRGIIAWCVILVVIAMLGFSAKVGWGLQLGVVVGALLGSASLSPPAWRRRVRAAAAKIYGDTLPWPQTVSISQEGLEITTPHSYGRWYWRGVRSITTTPTHIFFFVNQAQAVTVPARAFRSEAQFHGFAALAQRFWTEATGKRL